MRTGKNPAKSGMPAYQPQPLAVATIVYIPFQEGYFTHSLQIFKYQLASLRATTHQPFDLLVFDNGSCAEVVQELQELNRQGDIDYLVLSRHNLGKAGAWNWIFASLPNPLICYADSDVFFRPGWLEASLEIANAFPQAGMVSAQPNFYDVMQGQGKAHSAYQDDPEYTWADYWPASDIVDEFCRGISATDELARQFHEQPLETIQHRGVRAVIGASHMQFLIPKDAARRVIPLPATKALLRAETMSLDYKLDDLGYLHLSTLTPYVFHMGNTVTDQLAGELKAIAGEDYEGSLLHPVTQPKRSTAQKILTRLNRLPFFQQLFLRTYNALFQALNAES